jgi:Icc-related predicted phosphoesterase
LPITHCYGEIVKSIFVSDIHGRILGYQHLFQIVRHEKPDAVFFAGDLLPLYVSAHQTIEDFIDTVIFSEMRDIQYNMKKKIRFFVILGNDDPRKYEPLFIQASLKGYLEYVHEKTISYKNMHITGYSYVPPTPFQLKDWERYDISQYVDVGAVSPEQGKRTVPISLDEIKYSTIQDDLERLVKQSPAKNTIYLFHSPPYQTCLDQINVNGKQVDYAPLDTHVGSIAIKRFIETYQPFLTLHGHVHESTQITGCWKEKIGQTYSFTAAHHGPELAVVRFDTNDLEHATRDLIDLS